MESASESGRGQFQLYYLHFFEFRRYALRCFGRCLRETAELELRWAHRTGMSVFLKVVAGRVLRIRGAIPGLLQCIHERASLWVQPHRD
jgi:hypothetical protein